jgi:hypothetical protein
MFERGTGMFDGAAGYGFARARERDLRDGGRGRETRTTEDSPDYAQAGR